MNKPLVIAAVITLLFCSCPQAEGDKRFTERMAGSAESVNGILYVMGGMTLSANLSDVGAYDSSAKTWTPKASIPTPRSATASVVFENDIYVIGGRNENGVLPTVEKYITTENKWGRCAPMLTGRWSLMACELGDKLYVLGGISGIGNNRRALDIVETYDPKIDSWQAVGKMPEVRQGAAIAAVNGLIYVISGKIASYVEATPSDQITEHVVCFDPETKAWTRVQDIPTARVGARAVVANGLIFVVGGIAKGGEFPAQIDVFDPRSNQWSAGPRLLSGRSAHMCALVGDSIVVFGGTSVRYGSGRLSISGSMETVSISGYQQK